MKESLSSVETSSFYQLHLISSRGVFHVGCIQTKGSLSGEGYTMDDCIKVEIVAEFEESAATGKIYSLSDLQDLQSKLMLISGQSNQSGNKDVEYFVEVRLSSN